MNLGVRFDRVSPRTELNGAYYTFNPRDGSLVFPDQRSIDLVHPAFPKGIKRVTAATAGFPDHLINPVRSLAPRFGFAYRVTDGPSTVLRGSYGIFTVNAVVAREISHPCLRSTSNSAACAPGRGSSAGNT